MDKWFVRHERRGARLPTALATVFEEAVVSGEPAHWQRRWQGSTLVVSCLPLSGHFGAARWLLRLEERADAAPVPEPWRILLTQREQQVTSAVLRGWDNRLIGEELGCAEATVKKHLQRIFEKLGIESRTALVARAATNARVAG
jgi:DNA-binding CsgD family transcriptional regulator